MSERILMDIQTRINDAKASLEWSKRMIDNYQFQLTERSKEIESGLKYLKELEELKEMYVERLKRN